MATVGSSSEVLSLQACDDFHRLVKDLSSILGPSAGINSAGVKPSELVELMEHYTSKEHEWKKYAFGDQTRAYTRNLVDRGNGKSNLLILVWSAGKESPVHDHANAHCVMKVLKGSLKETRYAWPTKDNSPLEISQETVFDENGVTYMSDTLGLHKISNTNEKEVAVSLHLYTPPNAAKFGVHLFNAKTGEASHVTQANWYSEEGTLLP